MMKAASVVTIKKELQEQTYEELTEICLRLAKFKKENKELITYLLFESHNESSYIQAIKNEMDHEFEIINTNSYFYIKKSVRKILRNVKKYIKYSLNKETEIELLLYFCKKLKGFSPSIDNNVSLTNIYLRQIQAVKKKLILLHEDLQYDYQIELNLL